MTPLRREPSQSNRWWPAVGGSVPALALAEARTKHHELWCKRPVERVQDHRRARRDPEPSVPVRDDLVHPEEIGATVHPQVVRAPDGDDGGVPDRLAGLVIDDAPDETPSKPRHRRMAGSK